MQWQDIETVGDTEVPDIFRPLTPDNAEEYVRDYEGELSSLALAGADTPPHTIYMTGEDQHNNRPARIYTIASMPEGRYLTGRYIHDPDSTAHKKFLAVAKTIFSYHTTPSLRPWRIETAAMIPSYAVSGGRERLEFTDLAPALVEKRQAATAALNGLVHYLTPTARPGGSQQGMELLGEVFGYAIKHGVELNSPPEQTI
jgi:hypothetical protein